MKPIGYPFLWSLEDLGHVPLLRSTHSWRWEASTLHMSVLQLVSCVPLGGVIGNWSVWGALQCTEMLLEPSSSRLRRVSRKGSCPSESSSIVHCTLGSILFRWLWQELIYQFQRKCCVCVVHVSPPKPWGGVWKVDSTFCSMSSMTRVATTTETGNPIAVP